MKKILTLLINILLRIFYRDFDLKNEDYPKLVLLKYGIRQRIFRCNHHVPWPVHPSSVIKSPEKIQRGSKAPGFAKNCYFDGRNGIIFENNVWIAHGVTIISQDHDHLNYRKYQVVNPVVIKKNSLLGAHSTVLPGVELGEHTIVGAGAVVTKSFPEGNQVLGGNPAILIKKLQDYNG